MPATTPVTARAILAKLKPLGSEGYRRVLAKHGVKEPVYGVKIEELKKIKRSVKTDHRLAMELFETGVYDGMYLAGLIADDAKMTPADFRLWLARANSAPLFSFTIPWVAAGSPHGRALALEWIESGTEDVAVAGWSTLGGLVSVADDAALDLAELKSLLTRVATTIHDQPNGVRYAMNGFVIAVGSYLKPLTPAALAAAKQMGAVSVDMGDTSCKVPGASQYIEKVKQRGSIGKKRKTVKC
jgi:3-methyladenine DNA glycosylase AlkD